MMKMFKKYQRAQRRVCPVVWGGVGSWREVIKASLEEVVLPLVLKSDQSNREWQKKN